MRFSSAPGTAAISVNRTSSAQTQTYLCSRQLLPADDCVHGCNMHSKVRDRFRVSQTRVPLAAPSHPLTPKVLHIDVVAHGVKQGPARVSNYRSASRTAKPQLRRHSARSQASPRDLLRVWYPPGNVANAVCSPIPSIPAPRQTQGAGGIRVWSKWIRNQSLRV